MNPKAKSLWLEALRSGEYPQGYGSLRDKHDNYCVNGVLCQQAVGEGVIPPAVLGSWSYDYKYDGNWATVPHAVTDWAGLSSTEAGHITSLNDHEKLSFTSIANWIEENL